MVKIVLLILGVFISVIGIVNIMGNISTIHSYNRRKVKEEDIPKYGRAVNRSQLSDHHNTESAVGTFVYMSICFQTPFQIEAEFSCPIFCVDAIH